MTKLEDIRAELKAADDIKRTLLSDLISASELKNNVINAHVRTVRDAGYTESDDVVFHVELDMIINGNPVSVRSELISTSDLKFKSEVESTVRTVIRHMMAAVEDSIYLSIGRRMADELEENRRVLNTACVGVK